MSHGLFFGHHGFFSVFKREKSVCSASGREDKGGLIAVYRYLM